MVNDLSLSQQIYIIDARLGSKEASENNEIFRTKLVEQIIVIVTTRRVSCLF